MKIITSTMEQVQVSQGEWIAKFPSMKVMFGVDICANVGAFEETFSGNSGTVA